MFEGLRKKFSNVIKGFVKSEEEKAKQEQEAVPAKIHEPEPVQEHAVQEQEPEAAAKQEAGMAERQDYAKQTAAHAKAKASITQTEMPMQRSTPKPKPAESAPQQKHADHPATIESADDRIEVTAEPKTERHAQVAQAPVRQKQEPIIKLGIGTKIKRAIFNSVILSATEVEGLAEKLRVSMLESDVSYEVTDEFVSDLTGRLVGQKVDSKHINDAVIDSIRSSLMDSLAKSKAGFDLFELAKAKAGEPFVVLFLGPNGTGKTTTIAKLASRMKSMGITCVLSASDTFRAAAIEQIEHHANKIGVPVIKGAYGADPASIAFDAIAYARSRRINAVLVDSAGRQETNANLIREVEKMARVSKPDLTIYVGESTSGNAITGQIIEFAKHVRIDGIILTKLDCDAKGGSALSISHATGIPILFFGTGEAYDALLSYDPSIITNSILPAAA